MMMVVYEIVRFINKDDLGGFLVFLIFYGLSSLIFE